VTQWPYPWRNGSDKFLQRRDLQHDGHPLWRILANRKWRPFTPLLVLGSVRPAKAGMNRIVCDCVTPVLSRPMGVNPVPALTLNVGKACVVGCWLMFTPVRCAQSRLFLNQGIRDDLAGPWSSRFILMSEGLMRR
jgi:hypothetical protein